MFRTDLNRNPTAFTTDIAHQAGLRLGVDYALGESFLAANGRTLYTAHLIGDPVALTILVIDAIGFQTQEGAPRWSYINMPAFVWHRCNAGQKRDIIGWMYGREGGTAMWELFPNGPNPV